MTKVLVTGGTGFIGSNLVKQLVKNGNKVRIFDNNFRGNENNIKQIWNNVEYIKGDIRNLEQVVKATEGIDVIYHLAYINGTEYFYKYPQLVLEVGLKGHLNIMDACKKRNVKKFIYASSSEVYQIPDILPTPESVKCVIPDIKNARYSYGGGKILGELLTIHYAPEIPMNRCIFRPHNVYGPAMGFEHVIPQIVSKICKATNYFSKKNVEIDIQGNGDETRAFCYIEDAIEGIILIGDFGSDREIYNLGTDQEIKIIEIIKKIGDILDIKVVVKKGPIQKGSTPKRCPDISKLKKLNYIPKTNIRDGLLKSVEWYKDYFMNNREGTL